MNTDDPHLKCHLMSQIILHICPHHHVVVLNLRCRRSCHNASKICAMIAVLGEVLLVFSGCNTGRDSIGPTGVGTDGWPRQRHPVLQFCLVGIEKAIVDDFTIMKGGLETRVDHANVCAGVLVHSLLARPWLRWRCRARHLRCVCGVGRGYLLAAVRRWASQVVVAQECECRFGVLAWTPLVHGGTPLHRRCSKKRVTLEVDISFRSLMEEFLDLHEFEG